MSTRVKDRKHNNEFEILTTDEHFESWIVHACFGNSKRFRKKMIRYYNSLLEEHNE